MRKRLARVSLCALAVGTLSAAPAFAGNIALTGHDDDLHCFFQSFTGAACTQLNEMITFARAGSTTPSLPVLTFDLTGSSMELVGSLTALGVPTVNIGTAAAITDALFDPTLYSAFAVASDQSCGGCDNTPAFEAAIAAHSSAIASFFNAGGGILGESGAGNAASYYAFVPQTASGFGSPGSTGYYAPGTCFGTSITAVNGNPTHNFFPEPGTSGVSSLYCVAERNTLGTTSTADDPAETLLLAGGTITTGVITTTSGAAVPEPATLTLFGLGTVVAAYRRRRRA